MKAPDFDGKNKTWINSKPLSIDELKNKVVLVDFWTYSCINCLRTLPFIKEWHNRYKDSGLVIVGVHTPEFDFEKDPQNLKKFIKKNEIEYPVVMDNDYEIWEKYGNRYWPSKYLVDRNGQIRYHHLGEGAYDQTEKAIQSLLLEVDPDVTLKEISKLATQSEKGKVCFPATPETYAGYARGGPANKAKSGIPTKFSLPNVIPSEGFYLSGYWTVYSDRILHARKTDMPEDYMILSFSSFEVNAVLAPVEKPYQVTIALNGDALSKDIAGSDIKLDDMGNTIVFVDAPKMYNLINSPEYIDGILKISTESDDFELYAFTFGSCSRAAA
jgi:thiol-disulfide isomerase/thioredoxin